MQKINTFWLSVSFIFYAQFCLYSNIQAQNEIRGTIQTVDGEPLPNVTIQLKGTLINVQSDDKGTFEMIVPEPNSYDITYAKGISNPALKNPVLVCSADGFEVLEYKVSKLENIVLQLREYQSNLLFPERNPNTTSTSIGIYKPEQRWQDYLGNDWIGQIAGSQIDITPTEDTRILLRGLKWILAHHQPLIVLDGVYVENVNLNDLNPEDIAYVEVLKGAASTALYGGRGGNGVIEIQTKRGSDLSKGKSQIMYHTQLGFTDVIQPFSLATTTNKLILNPNPPQPALGDLNENHQFNTTLPNLQDYQQDILFRRGNYSTHQLSFAGKSGATNYYASAHRLNNQGIYQHSDGSTRTALRLNLDHQLNKKLKLQTSTAYSSTNSTLLDRTDKGYFAQALFMPPMFDLTVNNEEDDSPFDWDIENTGNNLVNPLYLKNNIAYEAQSSRLLGSIAMTYQLNKSIKISYLGTIDKGQDDQVFFVEKGFLSTIRPSNFSDFLTEGINNSNGGGMRQQTQQYQSLYAQTSMWLNRKLGRFKLDGGLIWNYENTHSFSNNIQGENIIIANNRRLDNLNNNLLLASAEEQATTYSGAASARLSYKEKFSLNGGYRVEQSSLFGDLEKFIPFYNYGVAYRLSEDLNIKNLQLLKLRAAIGTAGIRPTFIQRYGNIDLFSGTPLQRALPNPNLLPSTVQETEVGIDATVFRAFDISFSYFQNTAKDQILFAPVSATFSADGQWQNAGTVESRGYEAMLGIDFAKMMQLKATGLVWNTQAIFFKSTQQITALGIPSFIANNLFYIAEGEQLGNLYGAVFARNMEQLSNQNDISISDFVLNELGYLVNKNDLGKITEKPYQLINANGKPMLETIGNITPNFNLAFGHTIGFKGIQLYTLFDWQKGGNFYNHTQQQLYGKQRHADFEAPIAAGFFNTLYYQNLPNNHFIQNASYFMLREVALMFTLKNEQIAKIGEQIKFGLRGRNVWSTYDGSIFPQTSIQQDIRQLALPMQRSFALDVQFIF